MTRALQLGCSGFRYERFGEMGYYRPCGDPAMHEALITGAPLNIHGEPCSLPSDPSAGFSASVTDLSKIDLIVPTGAPAGAVIKAHSYLHAVRDGDRKSEVPVYAPAGSWLTSVAYYTTSLGTAEYLLWFDVSCEVSYKFDHILAPVDAIRDAGPASPTTSSGGVRIDPPLFFEAGQLVAHTRGAGDGFGPWDFGAYNTTHRNTFANQARYEAAGSLNQSLVSVCPYDLFEEPLRSQYRALFGGFSGAHDPDAVCSATRDVAGTVAGAWFEPERGAEGEGFSIATFPDGQVIMSGPGIDVRVMPGEATYADPATVTSSHCYQGDSAYAFLELLPADRLAVSHGAGTCPVALPADHLVFQR